MTRHATRLQVLSSLAVGLGGLALYLTTMAPGLTWAHYGADGGDLAVAVALGSVPHPTGYPTYLLIASLFAHLPWRDLHARLNLMSSVMAALAVGGMTWVGHRVLPSRLTPWPGVLAGSILATSTLFWSQALIAEVYALHALAVVLLTVWTVEGIRGSRTPAWALAGGLLLGLSLGNHVLVGLLLPGIVWAVGPPRARRHLILWAAGLIVGLVPYLWLPLRARVHMPPNWGGADTWEGFWWLVTGRLYRHYMALPALSVIGARARQLAALALDQFGWWGLALTMWGLVAWDGRPLTAYRRLTVWAALVYGTWALMYQVTDWPVYTLPIWILLTPWAAVGIVVLAEWARTPRILLVGLLAPLAAGVVHAPKVDLHADSQAVRTVAQVWQAIPPGALVLVDGDRATFGLGYTHFVLRRRPDVRLVNRTLWAFPWYRKALNRYYGDLLPDGRAVHLGALVDAAPRRPVYLVGDTVPGGVRFAPDGPYYHVQPVPGTGSLAVGRLLHNTAHDP